MAFNRFPAALKSRPGGQPRHNAVRAINGHLPRGLSASGRRIWKLEVNCLEVFSTTQIQPLMKNTYRNQLADNFRHNDLPRISE